MSVAAQPGTARAWLQLIRVSNLPTCLTNVIAGCALATVGELSWLRIAGVVVAVSCLYSAGMILNDVCDVAHDRLHRPERPLPCGAIPTRSAVIVAVILMGVAAVILPAMSLAAGVCAALLIGAIIGYDVLHRANAWTVLLMGACRGLVYWVAAAAVTWPLEGRAVPIISAAVVLYTVVLTAVARVENDARIGARRHLAWIQPVIVLTAACSAVPSPGTLGIAAAVIVALWLSRAAWLAWQGRTKPAILAQLAGFCLIDAALLAMLDRPVAAGVAAAAFILTVYGHRRIAGT